MLSVLLAMVFAAAPPAGIALPTSVRHALSTLPLEPPPARLNAGTHYFVSNERRPDLFYRHVRGRGGVYVGVGAEQSYVLAAWAQAEVIVLLDFDQRIVDLHEVYRALFLEFANPDDMIAAWADPARARAAIEAHVPPGRKAAALHVLERTGTAIHARLVMLRGGKHKIRRPTFLTDRDQYALLRRRFTSGRVFFVRGDLTGPATVAALGTALRQAGLQVRVLYLSNAEQYFMYTPAFRSNMLGLPTSKAVILRTLPARPRGFHYMVQSGKHFRAWLGVSRAASVYAIARFRRGEHYVEGSFEKLGPP